MTAEKPDDNDDKTQIHSAPPPQVKRTPKADEPEAAVERKPTDETRVVPLSSATPVSAAEAAGAGQDRTQAGSAAPPVPKLPPTSVRPQTPPEAGAPDRTSHGSASPPPVLPKPAAPSPEMPQQASTPRPSSTPVPPLATDEEEEGTVIMVRKPTTAATLQRIEPPGHSEIIHLDRSSYVLGRSHKCDVRLFSETSHREHARLTFREAAWYVQPLGGKTLIADGVIVRDEQRLAHKMRLQLGDDELLFFDEAAAVAPAPKGPAAAKSTGRLFSIVVVAGALAALAVAAWWLLFNGSRLR